MSYYKYSKEEDQWLAENINKYSYSELTRLYNLKFNRNIKDISDHCIKKLKIHRDKNDGCFSKGNNNAITKLPIGTERFYNGSIFVKIKDNMNNYNSLAKKYGKSKVLSKINDPNWIRKDYIIWINNGNELPNKDQMLIHLDKNPKNCSIENLYLTSRKINFMLSKNKWHSEDPKITLTAIKWCEHFYAIKES